MTCKLVVVINSLKFLVPNYSCLQNPCLGGCRPQIPVPSVLCPQLNLLNSPPEQNSWVCHWPTSCVPNRTAGNFCRMELKMKMMMKNCCKQMKPKRKLLTWFQTFEIKCVLGSTVLAWIKSSLRNCYCSRSLRRKRFATQDFSIAYFFLLIFQSCIKSSFLLNIP